MGRTRFSTGAMSKGDLFGFCSWWEQRKCSHNLLNSPQCTGQPHNRVIYPPMSTGPGLQKPRVAGRVRKMALIPANVLLSSAVTFSVKFLLFLSFLPYLQNGNHSNTN